MDQAEWVKCPVCGWHWKKEHTGVHAIQSNQFKPAKGEFTFEKGDLDEDTFISFRQTPGGRGNPETFKEIHRITLKEAKELSEYKGLVNSLKSKIEKIEKILK